MPPPLSIRDLRLDDLPAVVAVHRLAFRGFFLDRMGPAFLRGYYQAVLEYPGGLLLVAESTDGISGFAAGFVDPEGFYAHFRRRRWRLLPAILLALLRRPWLLFGILRNSARVQREAHAVPASHTFELSSIASATPGGGVGSALLLACIERVRRFGCERIVLTTDADNNEPVQHFYERHGFTRHGTVLRGARTLIVYHLDVA